MDSRMHKYHDELPSSSRVARNEELYKKINKQEINNFEVKSNATVIGDHENEIDIEKIKKILDTRYKEVPKRRSIKIEDEEDDLSIIPESTTKEYDINTFLAKAKNENSETYEEARAKKLRDTQFDILSNLNLPELKKDNTPEEKEEKEEDEDLVNLINTITINEVKQKDESNNDADFDSGNPLDLFTDLKGNENTEVFEGIKEEIEKIEKTSKVFEKEQNELKEVISEKEEKKEDNNKDINGKLDKTFYTTTNLFKKKDLVDDEFVDMDKMSVGVKVLICLLIVAFLVGLFIFLKIFLKF